MSEAARIYLEEWSAISQGDLGLKAGFWSGEGTEVTFKDIVGWITSNGRDPAALGIRKNFHPVVLGGNGYPQLAMFLDNYLGVFVKDTTPSDALKKSEEWRGSPEKEQQTLINVPGLGKA